MDPADKWMAPFLYGLKPGKAETLKIQSEIQERFIFLNDWTKLSGLAFFICLLLTGLFFLIYRISESMFLNKFIRYGSQPDLTSFRSSKIIMPDINPGTRKRIK
jgi:hypothetical protein